jgi:hypothetical protein
VRTFHRLLPYDPQGVFAQIAAYHTEDFDVTRLWDGEPMDNGIPGSIRLFVGRGKAADVIANPLSWPIFSDRFVDILAGRAGRDFQAFDAPLFESQRGRAVSGYKIVKIVRRVPSLDLANSDVAYDKSARRRLIAVYRIAVVATRVAPDIHVFRMQEWPYEIIFSDDVAGDCRGKGLVGLAFQKCTPRPGRARSSRS